MNSIKSLPRKLQNFAKRLVNLVCYPQYSLFVVEFLFFIGLIFYSIILALPIFNIEVIKTIFNIEVLKTIFSREVIKSILNILILYFLGVGLIVATIKFNLQKDLNYGGIKEQLNDTEDKGKILKTSIPKFFSKFHIYFLVLSLILLFCKGLSIGDTFINDLGIAIGLILFVFELFINSYAFSPFLLILMMFGIPAIVNSIGSEKTILNWSFLLVILVTIIGENLFEERLVNGLISKKISVENLMLRKISNNIWAVFLYFGIVLSENIVNSTYFYIFFTSQAHPIIAYLQIFVAKSLIFLLVFVVYLGTEKKIIYLIFRFYYRDKELKINDSLVRVFLDKNKKWRVRRILRKPKKLKSIAINTYKGKNNNVFYVEDNSEIPKKIDGLNKNEGKSILGKINPWTIGWFIIMIAIMPINNFIDYGLKIDDGIYKIEEKSDKAEFPNEIEVLGDTIVYNGKVESFDTRTQSFEHGTISIREIKKEDIEDKKVKKEDIIYIELTKNVGNKERVVYKK